MRPRVLLVLALAAVACGPGSTGQEPSPTARPTADSYEAYAIAFCAAWSGLFRAVGNPDTAEGSVLSKALDDAVTAHDGARAEGLVAQIGAELEAARQDARVAGGWPPATPMMTEMDRVLVGFEAMTAAKLAKARGDANAPDPQAALEDAGALDAWSAMFEAYRAVGPARPADAQPCPDVPISP